MQKPEIYDATPPTGIPRSFSAAPWMVAGVVIASPATGQIRAVLPHLGLYSDVSIEDIIPYGPANDEVISKDSVLEDLDMDREELKAHIENHDLRVDARLKDFEQKVSDGIVQMNHSLLMLDKDLSSFKNLKGTIILNSVLSVIAIVGIVIGVMSYGVASFDSGRDTSAVLQEVRQQSFENKQMLEQIRAQQVEAKASSKQ